MDKEWFDYLVGELGIGDRLTHRPSEMSGGQQQRCACARALINRPDLIFADEPTGNLDSNSSAEMLAFLRRSVTEFGQSIVMVTHDPRGAVLRRPGGLPGRRRHRRRAGRADPRLRAGADPDAGRPDMWRVTIKGLLAHKLRLALTALAIVLGVTFIAGTFVLTDTLHNTFDTLFGNIYQNIDFQVRGVAQFGSGGTATRNPVPESVAGHRARVPGVEAADGSVTGYAQYIAPDGKAISTGGAPTLGLSFDPDAQISALRLARAGPDDAAPGRHGPRDGAEVRLQGRPAGADPAAGADPDVHHRRPGAASGRPTTWPGRPWPPSTRPPRRSSWARWASSTPSTSSPDRAPTRPTVQRAIAGVLPRGVQVVTGQTVVNEATSAIGQALGFLNTALLVFAFIALFVGGFTILNTFSITVGQRTRELALLRIVGASRRQVFRSVLGEAAIVGLVSSLIGLGLGVLAALGLEKLLSGFGVTLPSGPLVFEARTVIVCIVVGVGVTLVSAISPARRAVRIAPVAAVSAQQTEEEVPLRRRFTRGGIITAVGIGRCWPGADRAGHRAGRARCRAHLRRRGHAGARAWPGRWRAASAAPWPGCSGCRAGWAGRTPCAARGGRRRRRRP